MGKCSRASGFRETTSHRELTNPCQVESLWLPQEEEMFERTHSNYFHIIWVMHENEIKDCRHFLKLELGLSSFRADLHFNRV